MATENNKIEFAPKKSCHNILVIYTKRLSSSAGSFSTKPSYVSSSSSSASTIIMLDPDINNAIDLSNLEDSKSVVNIYSIYDPACSPIDVSEKIVSTAAGIINDDLADKEPNSDFNYNLCDMISSTQIIPPVSSKKVNLYDFTNVPIMFNMSNCKLAQIDVWAIGEEADIIDYESDILKCKEQADSNASDNLASELMYNMKSKEKGVIVNGSRLYAFYSNKKNKYNRANVKSKSLPIFAINSSSLEVDIRSDFKNNFKCTLGKEKYVFSFDQAGIGSDKTAREVNSIIENKSPVPKNVRFLDFLSRLVIYSLQQEEEQSASSPFLSNSLKGLYNSTVAGASGITKEMTINSLVNPEPVSFSNISLRSPNNKPIKVYGTEKNIYDMCKAQAKHTTNAFVRVFN